MRRAVLFDVGGPIDMEFAYEIAVEGAIAAACGMEGIRLDQAAIDEASTRAVEAFAADAHTHMIETLCGDPRTVERVRQRVQAMVANLDVFQLRPGIDDLLHHGRRSPRRRHRAGQGVGHGHDPLPDRPPSSAKATLARGNTRRRGDGRAGTDGSDRALPGALTRNRLAINAGNRISAISANGYPVSPRRTPPLRRENGGSAKNGENG